MKYLITDPCYLITNEEWDKLGIPTGWGDDFIDAVSTYESKTEDGQDFKIIAASHTEYGDGSMTIQNNRGEHFTIGVDAGMVCLAEVPDDFNTTNKWEVTLGAFAYDKENAEAIYEEAKTI